MSNFQQFGTSFKANLSWIFLSVRIILISHFAFEDPVRTYNYIIHFDVPSFHVIFPFCITASGLGLGLTGSGSLTPPPPNAASLNAAAAAAGGLGLFGGQRFSNAAAAAAASNPGADRTAFGLAMAYATAAARTGGTLGFGSNNNLFNNTKTRHNSIDRASNNRSLLLEDFR